MTKWVSLPCNVVADGWAVRVSVVEIVWFYVAPFYWKRSMKITDVKTIVVNAEMRNWIFVKVITDQAGLFGWGEASLEWKTRAVTGAIEDFAPMLIGEDPRNIEHLYQKLYRHSFFRMGRDWHERDQWRGASVLGYLRQVAWSSGLSTTRRRST